MTDNPTPPIESTGSRTYSGIAVSERAANRRQRFVETGIELFGTVGYHATTMRTLIAATGLTNRYFYESFETLEDLLVACYEELIGDYRARLNGVMNGAPGGVEARTRAGLACFFEAMSDPRFAKITHSEVLGVSPRVDALYLQSASDFAALMMEFLTSDGVPIASHDPREMQLVGTALAGSVMHTGMLWVRSHYELPIELVVEATLKVILGTVSQLRVAPGTS
ncbi:TetR/AcrR family transcriptional regulator [Pseudomonas turukhanskensis]|uniref:TetR family transcriptional regulator n=1 Tax=Pseudomonas turukhanskensis TaxID=1806536 RepID=A0A9W6NHE5_9PSED|nr:TetR/AcrR family transcriptional regulator [Pseudomonas turukhanskensis]GLK91033.1 TetR family transcriptional regulator [Pseudomonas turukhanskensis]